MRDIYEKLKARWGTFGAVFIIVLVFILVLGVAWKIYIWMNPQARLVFQNTVGSGYGMTAPYASEGMMGRTDYGATVESVAPSMPGVVRGKITPPVPIPPVGGSNNIVATSRDIIRQGNISMLVEKAEDTVTSIEKITEAHNGFVDSSNVYEVSEGVKAGSITVRVPNKEFFATIDEIKKVAIKVLREDTSATDVTGAVADLLAQIKNLKATEEQYRQIMNRAGSIEEILQVAQRLSEVRGQIETTQAQLNYLSRQVAMSTISIDFSAEPEVKIFGIVWRPLTVLRQSARALMVDLAGLVDSAIRIVFALPGLIIRLALFIGLIWLVVKVALWGKRKLLR